MLVFALSVLSIVLSMPEPLSVSPKIENKIEIGRGSQGVVYKVQIDDKPFAMKSTVSTSTGMPKSVRSDISILNSLVHPNVVKFIGYWEDDDIRALENHKLVKFHCYNYLLELMDGDLFDFIEINTESNKRRQYAQKEHEMRNFYTQIRSALVHIHSRGIYHLGIKIENILIKSDYNNEYIYKLGGFGLATTNPTTSLVGASESVPPEMHFARLERLLLNTLLKLIANINVSQPRAVVKTLLRELRLKMQALAPKKPLSLISILSKKFKELTSTRKSRKENRYSGELSTLLTYIQTKYDEVDENRFLQEMAKLESSTKHISERLKINQSTRWDAESIDVFEFGKTLLDLSYFYDSVPDRPKNGICFDDNQQLDRNNQKLETSFIKHPTFASNFKFQSLIRKMMHCDFRVRPGSADLMQMDF